MARGTSANPFRLWWAGFDAVTWAAALGVATWMRFDFSLGLAHPKGLLLGAAIAAVTQLVVGFLLGPYAVGHVRGSFEEIFELTRATAITALLLLPVVWVVGVSMMPRSVPVIGGLAALTVMLAARMVVRTWRMRQRQRAGNPDLPSYRRVVVFGAGEGGRQLVRAMTRDSSHTFHPVALLDDDPRKARLAIEGVRVRGQREDLAAVAERYGADALAIAIPSGDSTLVTDLTNRAQALGLEVLVLPTASELMSGTSIGDLRDVNLNDLLGRREIRLDTTAIASKITGQRVLVTGAGGSIGSELCRQIRRFGPTTLVLLDRDESGLHGAQLSLRGDGLLDHDGSVLADIRDPDALAAAFATARPDIVFHAAALKHLPLLETYPLEALKTNVEGTINVLEAARAHDVTTFVNISTDKAADPTCVLGYSKRLAERLTAHFAMTEPAEYVSVRFGNVLGSRGSVIHAFTAQIQQGLPVTVTHPEVERYFMLIPEACQLVLEAAASTKGRGEVMVLDMGKPKKIIDVARTLIRMSGRRDIDIRFTGLRAGEKLSEDLVSEAEHLRPTGNPLVRSTGVPAMDPSELADAPRTDSEAARAWMREKAAVAYGPSTTAEPRPVSSSPRLPVGKPDLTPEGV